MTEPASPLFPRFPDVVASDTVAPDGTRVIVLLPDLETLLGVSSFSSADAIFLPGAPRPLTGWALFDHTRARITAH